MHVFSDWIPAKLNAKTLLKSSANWYRCVVPSPNKKAQIRIYSTQQKFIQVFKQLEPKEMPNPQKTGHIFHISTISSSNPLGKVSSHFHYNNITLTPTLCDSSEHTIAIIGKSHAGHLKGVASGLLSFLMASSERQGVHASCLMRQKGTGMIFLGASGTGKSLLASSLMDDEDYFILSDDWIDLIVQNYSLFAESVDTILSVSDNALLKSSGFQIIKNKFVVSNQMERIKYLIELKDVFPGRVVNNIPIKHIFLLTDTDQAILDYQSNSYDIMSMLVSSSPHYPFCTFQNFAKADNSIGLLQKGTSPRTSTFNQSNLVLYQRLAFSEKVQRLKKTGVKIHILPRANESNLTSLINLINIATKT